MFGLRLLKSTYREVLAKFGQPAEIQVGHDGLTPPVPVAIDHVAAVTVRE